jgi:hypothetical protein
VAADLLAASEGVPREVLRARLTQRLRDNLGLTEESARWAVDSWAFALGKLSQAELSAAATSATPTSGTVKVVGAAPNTRRRLLTGLGVGLFVVLGVAVLRVPRQPEQGDQSRAQVPVQPMEKTQSEN